MFFPRQITMTLGSMCNRDVVFVSPDESLATAIALMRKHHVGDVVVARRTEQGIQPVGILTDRDILLKVMGESLTLDDVGIDDVMSFHLITGHESDSLADGLHRMAVHGVRRLPVVNDHEMLIGIISFDDLIDLTADTLSELSALLKREMRFERDQQLIP